MMNAAWPTLALVLLAGTPACGGSDGSADAGSAADFVATDGDFAGFQSWLQVTLPDDPLGGIVYPPGTRVGFLNRRPPAGATRYPVGTVIIKAIEQQPAPQSWPLFGIAKRGDDYNLAGAVGWEFFLLRVGADGEPHITSRGLAPGDDGFDMDSASYTPGGMAGSCNICHGLTKYAAADHIIGDLLAPTTTATSATGP
jgi:hypothetical protein